MVSTLFDTLIDQQKASFDQAQKMWERFLSVPRVVEQARETRVGTTPHDIVYQEDSLKLLRYRRDTPATYAEPVLVCYALVNRPYILDLQPDKSVIRQLLARGFDVYMIDWGAPSAADRSLTLHDYVCGFLKNVTDFVCEDQNVKKVNLLGYCMGGAMSTMFTAVYPELVKNLILLAAPIDFSSREPLMHLWTDEKYFDIDALIDAYGNCPAPFLQGCFTLMKPVQNLYEKYYTFYDKMNDSRFIGNFFSMEKWVNDNIPVAGETFRQFVKDLYQRNQLVKGEFRLNHIPVKLDKIKCPLLLLTAKEDHLVPPESTAGIIPHVGSKDIKSMTINAGHVGLVVSSKAQKEFWPEATKWMADRSTATKHKG
jgi:polyhydroxyalkanoate synthase